MPINEENVYGCVSDWETMSAYIGKIYLYLNIIHHVCMKCSQQVSLDSFQFCCCVKDIYATLCQFYA